MNETTHCLMETRRRLVRAKPLNGLDYVEVGDFPGILSCEYRDAADSQRYLSVYFLGKLGTAPGPHGPGEEWRLSPSNFKITGGRRVTDIQVLEAKIFRPRAKDEDDVVVLRLDKEGDFSCYTLEIVNGPPDAQPAREHQHSSCRPCGGGHEQPLVDVEQLFDRRYRRLDFSFKAHCPSTLDCAPPPACAESGTPAPAINYLAKDYDGFRELILDRLALTLPDWKERHVPDVGIAVAEILAYHADHLSYYQDAVAQEAYLGTARRRISVRRHARLVDYFLHEGCNARAWVCCDPEAPIVLQPNQFDLRTDAPDDAAKPLVFEPVRRQRDFLLEAGDFFDLRHFVWRLLENGGGEVTRGLSADLRQKLGHWQQKHTAEAPLPAKLVTRLIAEINERVLLTSSSAGATAPVGDLAATSKRNRAIFDGEYGRDYVAGDCVALHGIYLDPAHACIPIYTWQNKDCCLEAGALECVLLDAWADAVAPEEPAGQKHPEKHHHKECDEEKRVRPPRRRKLRLRPGDVVIFEEVIGPQTGQEADADKSRRWAVRLIQVEPIIDRLNDQPVLRVRWGMGDALPFSFCLSRMGPPMMGPENNCRWLENISVVRGNVILVDHGETQPPEMLGEVEREDPEYRCRCVGVLDEISVRPKPFRPVIHQPDLTFAVPGNVAGPAAGALEQKPWEAVPALKVESLPPLPDGAGPALTWEEYEKLNPAAIIARPAVWNLLSAEAQEQWRDFRSGASAVPPPGAAAGAIQRCVDGARRRWLSRLDLLASGALDRHFVVEMDDERRAWLRFGGNGLGMAPEAGETFRACFRIGNGPAGNTGLETITVFHARGGSYFGSFSVRNPLPARGGTAYEAVEHARQDAPHVFRRRQLRAVTADDYARLAEKNRRVQRAGAEIRWTGSRQCVRVSLDPLGMSQAPAELLIAVRDDLLKYRRIGHDLEVIGALYVPVQLELRICVQPHVLRGEVEAAVRDALTSGRRRDGTPGFFHPDRITFGEPVRISQIIAAVQPLPGVMSVAVEALHRWGGHPCQELRDGYLAIGPLEVARLDQDPDFPENGTFKLSLGGGR